MKELSDYLVPVEEEAFGPLQTQLLRRICQRYGLPVAILYLADAQEENHFQYEAGSGFSGDPTPQAFKTGEGLLGQAALEKRPIAERFPTHLLISPTLSAIIDLDAVFWYAIPLLYQDQVQGVLVMAASEDKSTEWNAPEWKEFITEWGAYLQSVRSRRYIQALLEKTQLQNQELASREEELRQNLEELSVTQEEMRRTQELLTERTRWQELVIDLFSLTSSVTAFEERSLLRIFLAQASHFMGAQKALGLWQEPEQNTFSLLVKWSSKSVSQLWPEEWKLQPDLIDRLEKNRKAVSVTAHELLAEGRPGLSGWYVAPFYDVKGLRGILLFGFSEIPPLPNEVENALRALAIAFFSAIERLNKAFLRGIPDLMKSFSDFLGGEVVFLSAESIRNGDIPWISDIPLVQREAYLSALRAAFEKGGIWRVPPDIPVREVGLMGYQGMWLLRL